MQPFRKRGFTLIELIMTIIVAGVAAVPLGLLVSQHVRSLYSERDYTLARNLARYEMELVNNTAYASLATGTSSFSSYQGYDFDISRTVSYAFGTDLTAQSLKQITVSATRHGSATVLVSLTTRIANNVAYGL